MSYELCIILTLEHCSIHTYYVFIIVCNVIAEVSIIKLSNIVQTNSYQLLGRNRKST
jgi:hypothetical protein